MEAGPMSSQLNPNAAVFIPVSPTRLLMMDEAIITASPGVTFEEPSIEYTSGSKQVDYFMRDNFSTISNKMNELTTSVGLPISNLTRNPHEHMEHISIDQLLGIQNLAQKDLNNENDNNIFLGINNILNDAESECKNGSENNNILPTCSKETSEPVENVFPEMATTLKLEVSYFKIPTEGSHGIDITGKELTANDISKNAGMCSEAILTKDGIQKGLTPQRKKSKSRHRFKRRPKKSESNVTENCDGFITEHRKTPPIDLSFKPIQTFSDLNPFGALQTPITTTPTEDIYNLTELYKTPQETPEKDNKLRKTEKNQLDVEVIIPPSFILRRSPLEDSVVPFEELESPNEIPPFVHPPNPNNKVLSTELPKSPEIQNEPESSDHSVCFELEINPDNKLDIDNTTEDLNINIEKDNKHAFEDSEVKSMKNMVMITAESSLLDSLRPEYMIVKPKEECGQYSQTEINARCSDQPIVSADRNISDTITPREAEEMLQFTKIDIVSDTKTNDSCEIDIIPSCNPETIKPETNLGYEKNINDVVVDISDEDTSNEMQETSFTYKNTECENINREDIGETSKTGNDFEIDAGIKELGISDTTILKESNDVALMSSNVCSKVREETSEMRLELEDQISTSQSTPEELRNLVKGFEVINKDELSQENCSEGTNTYTERISSVHKEDVSVDPLKNMTSASKMDDVPVFTLINTTASSEEYRISNNDFLKVINQFNDAENFKSDTPECSSFMEESKKASNETSDSNSVKKVEVGQFNLVSIDLGENLANVQENQPLLEKEMLFHLLDVNSSTYSDYEKNMNTRTIDELSTFQEDIEKDPVIEMTEVQTIENSIISSESKEKELETPTSETGTQAVLKKEANEEEMMKVKSPIELEKVVGVTDNLSDIPSKQSAKPNTTTSTEKSSAAKTVTKSTTGVKANTSSATTGKSSSVKPSASSSAPAKPAASASGSTKPVATASTPTSSTAPSKSNVSSAAPSKSATSGILPSKPTVPGVVTSKSAPVPLSKTSAPTSPKTSSITNAIPSKNSSSSVASSKPVSVSNAAPSKPASISGVASSKPGTTSKPVASSSSTSKPVVPSSTPVKPTVTSSNGAKHTTAAPTTAKKPASTTTAKPTLTKTTASPSSKPTVSSTSSSKPVLKQLPVDDTLTLVKSPSKPSTPTSHPTTPTSPKSPTMKPITKSPPRPDGKSPLPAKSSFSPKPSIDNSSDKKPTVNSDTKPSVKKAETTKGSTTSIAGATTKPSTTTKPSSSGAKTISTATKSQSPTVSKPSAVKPAAANGLKQKSGESSDETPNVSAIKKSATITAKPVEKPTKEPAGGKLVANGKSQVNKTSPSLKADLKGSMKNGEKSGPSKKPEELKKGEKSIQVQEHKISTTNENANSCNDQSATQPLVSLGAKAVN